MSLLRVVGRDIAAAADDAKNPENERDPEEDPGLVTVFVRQEGAGRVCGVRSLPALHRGFDEGNRRKRSNGQSELPGPSHSMLHGLGTPVL